jgi:hypothetical protein
MAKFGLRRIAALRLETLWDQSKILPRPRAIRSTILTVCRKFH